MIQNPILPGFHPDPCICRKGNDFYIVVSSFEWFPGIPIYHSKDMKHWELYSHALSNADEPDLKKLPSAKVSGHLVLPIVKQMIYFMLCMVL